jgi:hypothetical protein
MACAGWRDPPPRLLAGGDPHNPKEQHVTLDELREQVAGLADLPGDTPVIVATDAEGNGFSPVESLDPGMYLAESMFRGEHYLPEDRRQALDDPDQFDQAPDGAVPALFLWPIN